MRPVLHQAPLRQELSSSTPLNSNEIKELGSSTSVVTVASATPETCPLTTAKRLLAQSQQRLIEERKLNRLNDLDDHPTLSELEDSRRQALAHLIPSVAGDPTLIKQAIAMTDCSSALHHERGVLNRCRQRLCPTCSLITGKMRAKEIATALDYHLPLADEDSSSNLVAIKVTLNAGERVKLSQLRDTIQTLHSRWTSLMRTVKIKRHLSGSLRATEFTLTHDNEGITTANPHIHGLLILEAPNDIDRDQWTDSVRAHVISYWLKAMRSTGREISAAGQQVEPLTRHTLDDCSQWSAYCTKGIMQGVAEWITTSSISASQPTLDEIGSSPETETAKVNITTESIWSELDSALKGLRLFQLAGSLKEARADAADHEQREREERTNTVSTRSVRPTHLYSFTRRRYVPADLWTRETDKPRHYLHHCIPRANITLSTCQIESATAYKPPVIDISDDDRARHYWKTGRVIK